MGITLGLVNSHSEEHRLAVTNKISNSSPFFLIGQVAAGLTFVSVSALFMVRQLLTYTLIASLLLQLFSREVIVMSFQLNRDFIAKNLCENRNRPQLNCDGKCYLAKKLKAEHDREDRETTERIQNMPVLALFCADLFSFQFADTCGDAACSVTAWTYLSPATSAHLPGTFQPPRIG